MALENTRLGNKAPANTRLTEKAGTNLTPGPYEAIIKSVDDNIRHGRLKVWIPDLGGGDSENPDNWITVSYASPFAGKTFTDPNQERNSNDFESVEHTYGFWAVPPDRGNMVLCMFINGDRNRGYWFGCVQNNLGHHMVPAIGGAAKSDIDTGIVHNSDVSAALGDDSFLPQSEVTEAGGENVDEDFHQVPIPLHEYQANRYIQQGLDRDPVLGARDSSSQRETPSAVFGISTPGRPLLNDPKDDPSIKAKIASGDVDADMVDAKGRKGGHTFVMDDGKFYGGGEMLRLRSAEGHMMLMDDDGGSMYMINADGTVWIEMAKSGHLNIYTSAGLNVRSDDNINFHSEKNVNIYAGADVNIKAGGDAQIDGANISFNASADYHAWGGSTAKLGSGGGLQLGCSGAGSFNAGGALKLSGSSLGLNSGAGPSVSAPGAIPTTTCDDVAWDGSKWTVNAGVLTSIIDIVPTHEPWPREPGTDDSEE